MPERAEANDCRSSSARFVRVPEKFDIFCFFGLKHCPAADIIIYSSIAKAVILVES